MARITSSQELIASDLADYEPYAVTLKDWKIVPGQWGNQLQVTWQLEDGDTIRDWLGLRLGASTDTGKVSKLRQCLNALGRKPETAACWFTYPDAEHPDDPYEWGYEGETQAYSNLTEGLEVIVRGKTMKNDKGQERYSIQVYQPVGKRPVPETKKPAKRRSTVVSEEVQATDDDEIPF